jgi:hypothetical protein
MRPGCWGKGKKPYCELPLYGIKGTELWEVYRNTVHSGKTVMIKTIKTQHKIKFIHCHLITIAMIL